MMISPKPTSNPLRKRHLSEPAHAEGHWLVASDAIRI
jgi:hypothetical protein